MIDGWMDGWMDHDHDGWLIVYVYQVKVKVEIVRVVKKTVKTKTISLRDQFEFPSFV
jgi:hypothetical protein